MQAVQYIDSFFHHPAILWFNRYRIDVFLVFGVLMWGLFKTTLFSPELWMWAISFFFSFTWLYLFNKIYDREEDKISQPNVVLIDENVKIFGYICWILFLVPIFLLLFVGAPLWPYIVHTLSGFAYSYPFLKGKRLKNFFVIKNLIAINNFMWPYVYMSMVVTSGISFFNILILYIPLFSLIWCIEILWDIRDFYGDKAANIKTIPVVLGVNTSRVLIILLASLAVFSASSNLLSTPFVAIWTIVMCLFATPTRPRWFYHLFLYIDILIIFFFS